ncbi:MAG: response regulator [Sphingobacteriia bacterium]|nr:response regulator [Sphingobacteriia bacterium]
MDKIAVSVLYVEDEEFIRMPMAEMLGRRLEKIVAAGSAKEAIALHANEDFDILLTDIRMPGLNGLELIKILRQKQPDIKAIILSAYNETDFFTEAIDLGIDGFLIKPIDRQKLFALLTKVGSQKIQENIAKVNEEKFMALAASANDAIIMLDGVGLVNFWNRAAEVMFGYSFEQIVNASIERLLVSVDGTSLTIDGIRSHEMVLDKAVVISEYSALPRIGPSFPVEISFTTFKVGGLDQFLLIIRDVSERKKREEELLTALDRANEATRAKQQFLSVMSHEIRTPLNGILGAVNLLLQENPREDQLDYFKTLEFSGNHLLSLVNDILDFSKIEANRIQFERIDFNLRELVKGLMKIFAFKANDKGIELKLTVAESIPDVVKGDPMRLNQILTNLIGNAVKFTEKGEISLKINITEQHEKFLRCRFEVADTGIGILPEKLSTIFEFFSQADTNTTRKYGGTGLGLAITRKLVELQNGTIEVLSEVNKGSSFSFELTFEVAIMDGNREVKASGNLQHSLKGIRILLVEDNKINQMIAGKFLNRWDAVVVIAENGKEALEKSLESKFDIILMDLQMPELDGYETSRLIRARADDYSLSIPIIALTASAYNEVKDGVMLSGMNDIINKPFIPDELNRIVHEYVTNQGSSWISQKPIVD